MNMNNINKWAASFGMEVIIRYKFIFFLLVILIVVAGYLGMQKVVLDSSNESFLPEGDETVRQNDRFKEIFGNEEFVFVYIEAENIFDYEVLTYIRELSEDIEEHLPFVKDVSSLTNLEYTEAHDDTLYVEDFIGDEIPDDPESLEEIKRKVLSKELFVDRIITKDAKKTGIAVSFEVIPKVIYAPVEKGFSPLDEANWPAEKVIMQEQIFTEEQAQQRPDLNLTKVPDPRKLIAPALKVILDRHRTDKYTVLTTGIPVIDYEGDRITSSEATKFGLIALLASIVLLVVIFRSFTGILGPFLVLAATLVLTYGMMGWINMPISMTGMIIPPLLLVISVSYSIHVINHFQKAFQRIGSRNESVRYAYEHSAWPCFVTAVTTAMGFASFLIVPMKPIRDIGIACAFGVFVAYVLVMILIPASFSFGKDKTPLSPPLGKGKKKIPPFPKGGSGGILLWWADFVIRNALIAGVVFLLLLAVLIGFSFKFRVESDMLEVMGDSVKPVQDSRYIAEQLGGMYSYEVFIELPAEGMAKQPKVLKTVDVIAAHVESWETTALSLSLTDIVKDLNMTMHNNDKTYYTIPDDHDLIAQYLLLYEMSGGENTEDWVDYEYKFLRLSVQVKEATMRLGEKFDELRNYMKEFPEGTKVTITGDVPILLKVFLLLSYGQIKSVLAALVAITFMMMLILKSIRVGLISMIPNVFPVIAITGVMGLLDYPLDIISIMIAPMIIGIAVDDTVHYIVHCKQEFAKTCSYPAANRETFSKMGKAIIFTSVILTIGFSIFGLSEVKSMIHMAVLSSVGIVSALAADLFITPILFVVLKPFGREELREDKVLRMVDRVM